MAVLGKGAVLKVVFLNWVFEDYGISLRFGKRVGAQIGFKGVFCFPGLSFSLNLMGIDSFEANSFYWIFFIVGLFQILGEKRISTGLGEEHDLGPRKRIKMRDLESVCRAEGTYYNYLKFILVVFGFLMDYEFLSIYCIE